MYHSDTRVKIVTNESTILILIVRNLSQNIYNPEQAMSKTAEQELGCKDITYNYSVKWPMINDRSGEFATIIVKMKQFKQPHVAELIIKAWASNWTGYEFNEFLVRPL